MLVHVFTAFLMAFSLQAQPAHEAIWDVKAQAWISPQRLAAQLTPGHVVVLGEVHASDKNLEDIDVLQHHDNHIRLMGLVAERGRTVSVGLEFVPYTAQQGLDALLNGEISDAVFKNLIGWSGGAFSIYYEKLATAAILGGKSVGINIPRRLARKVSKHGPNSLNSVDRSLVPDSWQWGSASYFERFSQTMNGHVAPEKIRNYFWAQTLWDDTMAWRTAEFMNQHRTHVFHVVVGAFHAEYKDGLPQRMAALGLRDVKVILQEAVENWDLNDLKKQTAPDPKYGNRADFLWFYKSVPVSSALATEK